MKFNALTISIVTVCALLLMGFLLLTGLTAVVAGASDTGPTSGCRAAPVVDASPNSGTPQHLPKMPRMGRVMLALPMLLR